MRRILLALLMFVSVSFAAWQSVAVMAMFVSVVLLAVIFMIGHAFGVREMTILAKDELYQVLVLAILIFALTGTDSILNVFSETLSEGTADNIQQLSLDIVDSTINDLSANFMQITKDDQKVSENAAKSVSCNVLKIGYSVSACGGFSMMSPAISLAGSLIGFAIGELHAVQKLITFGSSFGLLLILPVGIILRTFRFSRGAGGFLMALGVGLYIMLPLGVIFVEEMSQIFLDDELSDGYKEAPGGVDNIACNPGAIYEHEVHDNPLKAYGQLRSDIRKHIYNALIRGTLMPIVAMLVFISSIGFLSHISGATVDVAALTRLI